MDRIKSLEGLLNLTNALPDDTEILISTESEGRTFLENCERFVATHYKEDWAVALYFGDAANNNPGKTLLKEFREFGLHPRMETILESPDEDRMSGFSDVANVRLMKDKVIIFA